MTMFTTFGRLGAPAAVLAAAGGLWLCALSGAEAAGPYDGSVPLVCAPFDIMECEPGGQCPRRTAEEVNLPPFIHVDLKAKTMAAADDSGRTAPIPQVDRMGGRTLLHGGHEGRAWSTVIEVDTGKLSAGVVEQQGAFVIFGACTAR